MEEHTDSKVNDSVIYIDQETQNNFQQILEAAGILKDTEQNANVLARLRESFSVIDDRVDESVFFNTYIHSRRTLSLLIPCINGDLEAVKFLLESGDCDINEIGEEGDTPLSCAVTNGNFQVVEFLLKSGADPNFRDSKECTPLMEAASLGFTSIVKLLLEYRACVRQASSAGNTAMHYAATAGHFDIVNMFLQYQSPIEYQNDTGHTPLMEAASNGHVEVARCLVEYSCNVNAYSAEFKESALTLASYKGHAEMVKFLLEAGADHEHRTDEMHTALMEASMEGHVDVARHLLDHGSDVHMPQDSFESPLTLACCGGHTELAHLLIGFGADIEEVNDEGYTPLMEAAREGHEETVALLLAAGADVNARTEETQETALTLAACGGFIEVCDILINAGADLEVKAGCSTPLMEAAQEGHIELVQRLIKCGANVHATTVTGDTALHYAAENDRVAVCRDLIEAGASIEAMTEAGRTPLMKAARAGRIEACEFLMGRGSSVDQCSKQGDANALSLACSGGHAKVVEFLLRNGADPRCQLRDGSTMLIEAARHGDPTVVALLLDYPNCLTQPSIVNNANNNSSAFLPTSAIGIDPGHQHPVNILAEYQRTGLHPHIKRPAGNGELCMDPSHHHHQHVHPQYPQQQPHIYAAAPYPLQHSVGASCQHHPQHSVIQQPTSQPPLTSSQQQIIPVSANAGGEIVSDPSSSTSSVACSSPTMETVMAYACGWAAGAVAIVQQQQQTGVTVASPMTTSSSHAMASSSASDLVDVTDTADGCMETTSDPTNSISAGLLHSNNTAISTATTEDVSSSNSDIVTSSSASSCISTHDSLPQGASIVPPSVATNSVSENRFPFELPEDFDSKVIALLKDTKLVRHFTPCHLIRELTEAIPRVRPCSDASSPNPDPNVAAAAVVAALDLATSGDRAATSTTTTINQSIGRPNPIDASSILLAANAHNYPLSRQQIADQLACNVEVWNAASKLYEELFHANGSSNGSSLPPNCPDPIASVVEAVVPIAYNYLLDRAAAGLIAAGLEMQQQPSAARLQPTPATTTPHPDGALSAFVDSPPIWLQQQQHILRNDQTRRDLLAAWHQHYHHPSPADGSSFLSSASNVVSPALLAAARQHQHQFQQVLPSCNAVNSPCCSASSRLVQLPQPPSSGACFAPVPPPPPVVYESVASGPSCIDEQQRLVHPTTASTTTTSAGMQSPLIDVNACLESTLESALTLAAGGTNVDLVRLLLERGADREHRDQKGCTALHVAVQEDRRATVSLLLDYGAEIEALVDRTKDTALCIACAMGKYEIVEELLNRGANKEHRNFSDYTPLCQAASSGFVEIVQLLLRHGAEINSRTGSKLGISPLMIAAMNGNTEVVRVLIENGSDINAFIETNRNTALTLASFQGRHEVVSLLVEHKANIEHRAKTGLTPLMEAASGNYVEVGKILLDHGADVNTAPVPSSRDTALTIAADKGNAKFVNLLLEKGAIVEVRNKKGASPLWLASNGGHLEVVQSLINYGADVNSQDNRKVSLLMAAFRKGQVPVVRLLVQFVTQFPSDKDCLRHIRTAVMDPDLDKRCRQCRDIIIAAKEKQEGEARKNANCLLEQIEQEETQRANREATQARKRERKRMKRKAKQEKERTQAQPTDSAIDDGDHQSSAATSSENVKTPTGRGDSIVVGNDEGSSGETIQSGGGGNASLEYLLKSCSISANLPTTNDVTNIDSLPTHDDVQSSESNTPSPDLVLSVSVFDSTTKLDEPMNAPNGGSSKAPQSSPSTCESRREKHRSKKQIQRAAKRASQTASNPPPPTSSIQFTAATSNMPSDVASFNQLHINNSEPDWNAATLTFESVPPPQDYSLDDLQPHDDPTHLSLANHTASSSHNTTFDSESLSGTNSFCSSNDAWTIVQPSASSYRIRGSNNARATTNSTTSSSQSQEDWKTAASGSSNRRRVSIAVSRHDIGKVIGQGGAVVSALRNMSGVQIDIESARTDDISEPRMVYLKGPNDLVIQTHTAIQGLLSGLITGNDILLLHASSKKSESNISVTTLSGTSPTITTTSSVMSILSAKCAALVSSSSSIGTSIISTVTTTAPSTTAVRPSTTATTSRQSSSIVITTVASITTASATTNNNSVMGKTAGRKNVDRSAAALTSLVAGGRLSKASVVKQSTNNNSSELAHASSSPSESSFTKPSTTTVKGNFAAVVAAGLTPQPSSLSADNSSPKAGGKHQSVSITTIPNLMSNPVILPSLFNTGGASVLPNLMSIVPPPPIAQTSLIDFVPDSNDETIFPPLNPGCGTKSNRAESGNSVLVITTIDNLTSSESPAVTATVVTMQMNLINTDASAVANDTVVKSCAINATSSIDLLTASLSSASINTPVMTTATGITSSTSRYSPLSSAFTPVSVVPSSIDRPALSAASSMTTSVATVPPPPQSRNFALAPGSERSAHQRNAKTSSSITNHSSTTNTCHQSPLSSLSMGPSSFYYNDGDSGLLSSVSSRRAVSPIDFDRDLLGPQFESIDNSVGWQMFEPSMGSNNAATATSATRSLFGNPPAFTNQSTSMSSQHPHSYQSRASSYRQDVAPFGRASSNLSAVWPNSSMGDSHQTSDFSSLLLQSESRPATQPTTFDPTPGSSMFRPSTSLLHPTASSQQKLTHFAAGPSSSGAAPPPGMPSRSKTLPTTQQPYVDNRNLVNNGFSGNMQHHQSNGGSLLSTIGQAPSLFHHQQVPQSLSSGNRFGSHSPHHHHQQSTMAGHLSMPSTYPPPPAIGGPSGSSLTPPPYFGAYVSQGSISNQMINGIPQHLSSQQQPVLSNHHRSLHAGANSMLQQPPPPLIGQSSSQSSSVGPFAPPPPPSSSLQPIGAERRRQQHTTTPNYPSSTSLLSGQHHHSASSFSGQQPSSTIDGNLAAAMAMEYMQQQHAQQQQSSNAANQVPPSWRQAPNWPNPSIPPPPHHQIKHQQPAFSLDGSTAAANSNQQQMIAAAAAAAAFAHAAASRSFNLTSGGGNVNTSDTSSIPSSLSSVLASLAAASNNSNNNNSSSSGNTGTGH